MSREEQDDLLEELRVSRIDAVRLELTIDALTAAHRRRTDATTEPTTPLDEGEEPLYV